MRQHVRRWHTVLFVLLVVSAFGTPLPAHAVIMPPVTASGITWVDANCDGIRSPDEPPLDIRVTLFASGADGQVNTPDDQIIEQSGANGGYRFTLGQPGLDYRLVILPTQTPIGYRLAPYQAGDNRTRDNDFSPVGHYGTWATSAFRFNASATVTGIDLGACPVPVYRIYLPLTQHS